MKLPKELQGKTWTAGKLSLNSGHLTAMLGAIRRGEPRATAIPGAKDDSDRAVDRATQLLRKAGLIRFSRGKWWILEAKP